MSVLFDLDGIKLGIDQLNRIAAKRVATATAKSALQSLLKDFLADAGAPAASAVLADAIGELVTSGQWSAADARTVLYSADRRIDQVTP